MGIEEDSFCTLGYCVNDLVDPNALPESGATHFAINLELRRYDCGVRVTASYSWNEKEPDCLENRALLRRKGLVYNELKTMIPLARSLGRSDVFLTFKTVDGKLTFEENKDITPIVFPPVPNDLDVLPRISIHSLTRGENELLGYPVDEVFIDDDDSTTFAFKRYPQIPELTSDSSGLILDEVQLLLKIDSPYIIKPTHIVIDDRQGPPTFRGFLMPFYSKGTLRDVLRAAQDVTASEHAVEDCHSRIEWALKRKWASQIASGVAALHQHSFCGDLKLENILISNTNDVCLIDVAPTLGWSYPYAPPEFGDPDTDLTAPRDVYSMGVIFWALAREITTLGLTKHDIGSWEGEEGEGVVPSWYKDLVESCLAHDPLVRPTVQSIELLFSSV